MSTLMRRLFVAKDDWAFMAPMRLVDTDTGVRYLSRLRVVMTPWFAVFVHRLGTPDPGEDLHDHPFSFFSIILWGGYVEHVELVRDALSPAGMSDATRSSHPVRTWRTGSFHTLRMDQCHRIFNLRRTPTWTMIVTGSRTGRTWGFYTPDGFVSEDEYKVAVHRPLDEEYRF